MTLGCTRSHPHENMDEGCEIRTEIAKLQNKLARVEAEKVSVKHIGIWIDYLKKQSDNGKYKNIPSGLSGGTCFELASDLESFIKLKSKWKSITKEEINEWVLPFAPTLYELVQMVEAKLKEKNHV